MTGTPCCGVSDLVHYFSCLCSQPYRCDHLMGEESVGCSAFSLFVTFIMYVAMEDHDLGQIMRKRVMSYANNKDADQPAHPRGLISTFVFRCLDGMICILAISDV